MSSLDLRKVRAFLEDAKDNPDDDTPRLILADWLEDHGETERAEFIRVRCRQARLAESDPEQGELLRRENVLRHAHAGRWLADICKSMTGKTSTSMPRGLIQFTDSVASFLKFAEAAGPERWAWVDTAAFFDQSDADLILRLLRSDWIGGLNELGFWNSPVGNAGVRALAGEPASNRLRVLELRNAEVRAKGLAALAGSPNLQRLKRLAVSYGDLRVADVRALLKGDLVGRIKDLELADNRIGTAGVQALAGCERLAGLERLDLNSNELHNPALVALARSPHLTNLHELDVQSNYDLGPPGARALALSATLSGLRRLSVGYLRFGDSGLSLLAGSPHLTSLTVLRIESNDLSAGGLRALADSRLAGRLTELNLYANSEAGDEGAAALAAWPVGAPLTRLDASHLGMQSAGVAALAKAPGLAGLTFLNLWRNPLGPAGARQLAGAALANLVELDLGDTGLCDDGAEALARAGGFPKLQTLRLRENRISDAGVQALARARWLSGLVTLDLSENAIVYAGARALAESPYLGGLCDLRLLGTRLTERGQKLLLDRFGPLCVVFRG
jgi:uncharacterized protein (TIGR02996 family)